MSGSAEQSRTATQYLRESLVTGTAIVVPVFVTVFVLFVGLDFLSGLLGPLAVPIDQALGGRGAASLLANVLAVAVLLALILFAGGVTESEYGGNHIERGIDATMARIPGINSIYGTLDQVSEMLLESDTESFKEVVLVEYPREGSYSVAFKTAETKAVIAEATDSDEMTTVFMPMGPNPVMGGFILHIRRELVHDVDLTVEEGISSVVSFGVALDSEQTPADVDPEAYAA